MPLRSADFRFLNVFGRKIRVWPGSGHGHGQKKGQNQSLFIFFKKNLGKKITGD